VEEELIKYVMERADKQYDDDFPICEIETWIREFFDTINSPEIPNSSGALKNGTTEVYDPRSEDP